MSKRHEHVVTVVESAAAATTTGEAAALVAPPSFCHAKSVFGRGGFTRVLRHLVLVCLKMALGRFVFGLVKQLLLKAALFKGLAKIVAGVETEVVSANAARWALFGGCMAAYRPLQVALELLCRYAASGRWVYQRVVADPSATTAATATAGETPQQQEEEDLERLRATHEDEVERLHHGHRPHHGTSRRAPPPPPAGGGGILSVDASRPDAVKYLSAAAAGALVSLPALRIFNTTTRVELCLYVVVRACYSVCSAYLWPVLPAAVQRIPTGLMNSVAMGVASTAILHALSMHPGQHSPEYTNFLIRATTFARAQVESPGSVAFGVSPLTVDYCAERGVTEFASRLVEGPGGVGKVAPPDSICCVLHPETKWCNLAFIRHMFDVFTRVCLPLYGPLKLLTTIAKSPTRILRHPISSVAHIAQSVVKSSMFLTAYVCGSYRVVCLLCQLGLTKSPYMSVACGGVTAVALTLEPAERQTDLVLFCMMHALRCSVLMFNKFGLVPRPTLGTVAVAHTAAWALLFMVFETRRETLRGMFASAMQFFVGDARERSHADHHAREVRYIKKHSSSSNSGGGAGGGAGAADAEPSAIAPSSAVASAALAAVASA